MVDLFSLVLSGNLKDLYNEIEKDFEKYKTLKDIKGRSLVHYAVFSSHIDILEYLLKKGFNPNIACHSGETPLFDATRRGNLEIAKLLIANGASVKITNHKGESVIHLAYFKGDEKYIKLLKENGANDELLTNYDQTVLHYAITGGKFDIVEKFLKNQKFDFLKIDKSGNSYLHHIAKIGNLEYFEKFLKKGLDINLLNYVFETPLFNATRSGNIDLVKFLINEGAYIQIINKDFKTVYDIANISDLDIMSYYYENFMETLDYKVKSKEDALIIAVLNRDYWEIKKLIVANTNIKHKNRFGKDAIHYARKYRFKMSEDLLLGNIKD